MLDPLKDLEISCSWQLFTLLSPLSFCFSLEAPSPWRCFFISSRKMKMQARFNTYSYCNWCRYFPIQYVPGPAAPGALHGISYHLSIIIKLIKKYSENRNVLSKLSLVFCSDYNGAPVKMVSSPTSPQTPVESETLEGAIKERCWEGGTVDWWEWETWMGTLDTMGEVARLRSTGGGCMSLESE